MRGMNAACQLGSISTALHAVPVVSHPPLSQPSTMIWAYCAISLASCHRMATTNHIFHLLRLLIAVTSVFAYVPAQPTNSSDVAIAGGLNITDISKLYLRWYSNGLVCCPRRHISAHTILF